MSWLEGLPTHIARDIASLFGTGIVSTELIGS